MCVCLVIAVLHLGLGFLPIKSERALCFLYFVQRYFSPFLFPCYFVLLLSLSHLLHLIAMPFSFRPLSWSVISATDSEGGHLWGRNFDWTASVPIIVKCMPKEGYASISSHTLLARSHRPLPDCHSLNWNLWYCLYLRLPFPHRQTLCRQNFPTHRK